MVKTHAILAGRQAKMALTFGSHLAPSTFEKERDSLLNILVSELIREGGPPMLRVANSGDHGDIRPWHRRSHKDHGTYDYRSILPQQLTFDVGDHGDWPRTVRDTHAIWDALNWLGVPYWGSLSDGLGTHTELFLDAPADRIEVAKAVLNMAHAPLGIGVALLDGIEIDMKLVAPAEGAHVIREFGSFKSHHTDFGKALWTVGPGPYEPLLATRGDTYRRLVERIRSGEKLRVPDCIPTDRRLSPLVEYHDFCKTQGGHCPRSFGCFPGPHRDPMDFMMECEECPVNC